MLSAVARVFIFVFFVPLVSSCPYRPSHLSCPSRPSRPSRPSCPSCLSRLTCLTCLFDSVRLPALLAMTIRYTACHSEQSEESPRCLYNKPSSRGGASTRGGVECDTLTMPRRRDLPLFKGGGERLVSVSAMHYNQW